MRAEGFRIRVFAQGKALSREYRENGRAILTRWESWELRAFLENCAIICAETSGQKPLETGRFGRKRAARPALWPCDMARFVLQNAPFGKAVCAVWCSQMAHIAKWSAVFVKIFRATALPVFCFTGKRSVKNNPFKRLCKEVFLSEKALSPSLSLTARG